MIRSSGCQHAGVLDRGLSIAGAGWIAEQADRTLVTYLPGGNRFGKSRSMLAALATIADLDEDGRREWQLAHDAQARAAR